MYAIPKASYDAYIQNKSRKPPQEPSKRVIRGLAGLDGRIKQLQTVNETQPHKATRITFGPNEIKEISPRGKGRPVVPKKRKIASFIANRAEESAKHVVIPSPTEELNPNQLIQNLKLQLQLKKSFQE